MMSRKRGGGGGVAKFVTRGVGGMKGDITN